MANSRIPIIEQARAMAFRPQIAVILSTYQRPDHLYRSLHSLALQLGVDGQYEVVVTDDGSTDHTEDVVRSFAESANFPVTFTTHEHRGFHLVLCRNQGVLASRAPYLLFSDADCIFPPNHLFQHLKVRRPGIAWSGDCLHLDERSTLRVDDRVIASGEYLGWIPHNERQRIQRRWIKDQLYQAIGHPKKPKLTGSNIAVWREDFQRINGFDERFVGWGCEDDDLADRLRASGVRIASILGSTHVFHMWHPPDPSRPKKWSDGTNVDKLLRQDKPTRCVVGLSEHKPFGRAPHISTPHTRTTSAPGRRAAA
jgi:GT2 family glycosyltransferase